MALNFRVGHGYDIHRLEPLAPAGRGRPLVLAGVRIPHDTGPVAHSDGDAVLHALADAILGALGQPDIGQLFPDTDPGNESADSSVFVKEAMKRLSGGGFAIGNLDITVICESPRLIPHKAAMIDNLARMLDCGLEQINLKGKTHEKVDAVGEGRAIEVHVVALIQKR